MIARNNKYINKNNNKSKLKELKFYFDISCPHLYYFHTGQSPLYHPLPLKLYNSFHNILANSYLTIFGSVLFNSICLLRSNQDNWDY